MQKLTPGPWAIENPDSESDCCDSIHPADDVFDPIVQTDSGTYGPRLRDAYLIAAAPEMYGLLEELECAGWEHSASGPGVCPLCRRDPFRSGHSRNCELGNLLRRLHDTAGTEWTA